MIMKGSFRDEGEDGFSFIWLHNFEGLVYQMIFENIKFSSQPDTEQLKIDYDLSVVQGDTTIDQLSYDWNTFVDLSKEILLGFLNSKSLGIEVI